jgi:hypothetical protein
VKKKMICLLVCCLPVIAMCSPVSADSKVDFSGAFYLWAVSEQEDDHDPATDDDRSYFEQKLRVSGTYKANDNVSANLRADYSDGVWGDDFTTSPGWAEASEDQSIEVERAYVTLKRGIFSADVGQHWSGTANYILWDSQSTGVTVKFDLPVDIALHYSKVDEKGGLEDKDETQDTDFYAANFAYSSDAFATNLTYAALDDQTDNDVSPWAIGLQTTTKLGPVGLNVEVDQFGGSDGANDVIGTQAYLDANLAPSKAISCGLRVLYAMGTDDPNETQVSHISAWVESFLPFGTEGPMWGWPYTQSTHPVGYPIKFKTDFDPAGANGGVVAFSPYIIFKATENLTLRAKVAHLTPQEDANTQLDDIFTGFAQVDWTVPMLPGTTLSAAYIYDKPSYKDATPDDANTALVGQLMVDF